MVLALGSFAAVLGVVVGGLIGIVGWIGPKRHDMAFRKRWNWVVFGSVVLGLLCLAPFMLGFTFR